MKALTIWQPWATLIACGAKQLETRDWSTSHRGPLAIHAGKRWEKEQKKACYTDPFREVLRGTKYRGASDLPRGKVLCVCTLDQVWPADNLSQHFELTAREKAFGSFAEGRFAWKLDIEKCFDDPIASRGKPGLWDFNYTL